MGLIGHLGPAQPLGTKGGTGITSQSGALLSATCGTYFHSLGSGLATAAEGVASAIRASVPGSDPCLLPPACHSSLQTLCPGCALGSTNPPTPAALTHSRAASILSWFLPLAGGWAVLGVPFHCYSPAPPVLQGSLYWWGAGRWATARALGVPDLRNTTLGGLYFSELRCLLVEPRAEEPRQVASSKL